MPRDNACHLGIRDKDRSAPRITRINANDFLLIDFFACIRVIRGPLVFVISFPISVRSASGAGGSSDTEGKAAKGSGERGGSRESFKSVVQIFFENFAARFPEKE